MSLNISKKSIPVQILYSKTSSELIIRELTKIRKII